MSERRDYYKTHSLIEKAFCRLLLEKESKTITATDLIEEAGISRGTFYAHFKNMSELTDNIEKIIIESIVKLFEDITIEDIFLSPKTFVVRMLEAIEKHRDLLLRILLSSKNPKSIYNLKVKLNEQLTQNKKGIKREKYYLITGISIIGAVFDSCMNWLNDDKGLSREELIELLNDFLNNKIVKGEN